MTTDTCDICGFPVTRAALPAILEDVFKRIDNRQGTWLLTLNTEMLARCTRDRSYFDLIVQADVITADGMPLVWGSRWKGADRAIASRTTGVDLVNAYLNRSEVPTFAIIGGVDPAATLARYGSQAQKACAYLFDGKVDLSEAQLDLFATTLEEREVKTVFIALGVPKQDRLALALRARLPHLLVTGIGGTFEILGPQGSRAPMWMQKGGLEWLYRLVKEPRRLWRRYLISYPAGIRLLIKDCLMSRG
jgi:N-acetylglucosaminyldiphosphoundecaprenol N-acetyl-beta-D-mannosaminyltransferase